MTYSLASLLPVFSGLTHLLPLQHFGSFLLFVGVPFQINSTPRLIPPFSPLFGTKMELCIQLKTGMFLRLMSEIYDPILSNFLEPTQPFQWGTHCTLGWRDSHRAAAMLEIGCNWALVYILGANPIQISSTDATVVCSASYGWDAVTESSLK